MDLIRTLNPGSLAGYLVRRGLAPEGQVRDARELEGGVSNVVLRASVPGGDVVLKQSLPQLRVEDEWLAKRERLLTEGCALRALGALTPGLLPRVLDVDPELFTLVMEAAPSSWQTWKADLMQGHVDPHVAATLGTVLGIWHRETAQDPSLLADFDDQEAFTQLRLDPYHRTAAERVPEAAAAVEAVVERMAGTRGCLVHGDFSPKNILVGAPGLWVLDFEVAHTGDPAFDLAFLLTHLALKALHLPPHAQPLLTAAVEFLRAYDASVGTLLPDRAHIIAHTGCLLLARAVGKSPAEYLDAPERSRLRAAAVSVLLQPPADLPELWHRVTEV